MATPPAELGARFLVAYARETAMEMLREWTPRRLAAELRAGRFGGALSSAQRAELEEHLTAWAQRALDAMSLRDALLIDIRRGRRVFDLICADLTVIRAPVPQAGAAELPAPPAAIATLPAGLAREPDLAALAEHARGKGLTLVVQGEPDRYPFPDNLEALVPPLPPGSTPVEEAFEQPTGWRRSLAALLAAAGVLALAVPLLAGHIPDNPAGLPLALLTLALLVGIRAGWPGFVGSLCIWLVANLPGFRHGTDVRALLPALPLLAVGVVLLSRDRHVRAMWGWIRERLGR